MGRVFSDLATANYGASGHPEAPFRIAASHRRLSAAGHKIELPTVKATIADVGLLHSPGHFESVRSGTFQDADTPHFPNIDQIALISLSGALSAAETAAQGEPSFSLMRPPGHHAGRDRVSGFCYFNNVALACAARQKAGLGRIAILDVDVHHGDGTEELMLERDGVLFCSLHQAPLYPGTGLLSRANCRNFPLPAGTDESGYLAALEIALGQIVDFKPSLLAVSAGFDTYKEDPIAGLKLGKKSYARVGKLIAQTRLPRFAALEGGYASELPELIENFLDGFFP